MSCSVAGDVHRDPHPWRAGVWLTLGLIAVGMLWTMALQPMVLDKDGWTTAADVWIPMKAAHFVGNGAFLYLYESNPDLVMTPGLPILLAPIAALGDAMLLTEGGPPIPAPRPQMWLMYGPLGIGLCFLLLVVVRRFDTRFGRGEGPRPLLVQVAVALIVAVPAAVVYGHFEDVVALSLVLLCLLALFRGNVTAAGLALGFAGGFKQWALLAVPMFALSCPRGERTRGLAWGVFPPAALVVGPLLFDWEHSSKALLHAQAFPGLGRAQLWIDRAHATMEGSPSRALVVLASVAAAVGMRGLRREANITAAFGLVFLIRLLLEPTIYSYYLAPSIVLLLLAERARGGSGWYVASVSAMAVLWFLARPPLWIWWPVFWALVVVLALPALRVVIAEVRRRDTRSSPQQG